MKYFRGPVKRVRLGDLDLNDDTDDAKPQDFLVKDRIPHPNYKPTSHYNDIALIKLDRRANFTDYVKVACLPPSKIKIPEGLVASASGWGKIGFTGELSSHLMDVDLNIIGHEECARSYEDYVSKRLAKGILEEFQMCAGHQEGKDTCPVSFYCFERVMLNFYFQGDSGGPLQIVGYERGARYFYVIGVTSFGKTCGYGSSAGVYSRVSKYVSWIENIVWPDVLD